MPLINVFDITSLASGTRSNFRFCHSDCGGAREKELLRMRRIVMCVCVRVCSESLPFGNHMRAQHTMSHYANIHVQCARLHGFGIDFWCFIWLFSGGGGDGSTLGLGSEIMAERRRVPG